MPCQRGQKARKTRKVSSKRDRDASVEIVTRNFRSDGLKVEVLSTSKACDAAEDPQIQHMDNQDTNQATLEVDKTDIQPAVALEMYDEDNETSRFVVSGDLTYSLNRTDLVRSSFNGQLVTECTQKHEDPDAMFQNEYTEDMNAEVSYNVTSKRGESKIEDMHVDVSCNVARKREESNINENMNADISYNVTSKREESNVTEDVNADLSHNVTHKREDSNITEDMNAEVSYNRTRKREESNITEDLDEKQKTSFQKQPDSYPQLQHDNGRKVSRLQEHASKEVTMPFSRTAESNRIEASAVEETVANEKAIHKDEDNFMDRDLPSCNISMPFKSLSQSTILQINCDEPFPRENYTGKPIDDFTNVFLSQSKQSCLDTFGKALVKNTTSASPASMLLKRKVDNQLFSTQPQVKKFKTPSTISISDRGYNTTDSVYYPNKDLGIHNDNYIQSESVCDSVVVVDAEAIQRNTEPEDMLLYSTAICLDKSCAGNIMGRGESGFQETKDVKTSEITEEGEYLATTQSWYPLKHHEVGSSHLSHLPDCAKVNEELSLSLLPDCACAKVNEELTLSHFPDCAKVNEELSLSPHLPGCAMVNEEPNLLHLSECAKVNEEQSLSHLPDCVKVNKELSMSHLPHCAKVNEELSLSHLPDHNREDKELTLLQHPDHTKEHEELTLLQHPDHTKVHEELTLPQYPDHTEVPEELTLPQYSEHAKVYKVLSLVTKSDISEQEPTAWFKDSMKDHACESQIRSEMQKNLDQAADNNEDNKTLTASTFRIIKGVKYDDPYKDKTETINELSEPSISSLTKMGHSMKPNQNSMVNTRQQYTDEANDSELPLTCVKENSTIYSYRYKTDTLDNPKEKTTLFPDVHINTNVNVPFKGGSSAFSNSDMLEHNDKENLTFTTQECITNTSVLCVKTSRGANMEYIQHNEKEDLACMSTQEFTINDLAFNDFISKERIENAQLTHGSVMTALVKEGNNRKGETEKATANLDHKIYPPLLPSCSNMKEGNSSDIFEQEQMWDRSENFSKDTFNGNKCVCVNKLTNADKVTTHGDMFSMETSKKSTCAVGNQSKDILTNKHATGRVTVESSMHTDTVIPRSFQDVFDNTESHPLSSNAQTGCDKFQRTPQSDDWLIQGDISLKSDSLITGNQMNHQCSQQPPMQDGSVKESNSVSASLSSTYNANIREIQADGCSDFIQKCRLESPVIKENPNQVTEDAQLRKSNCIEGNSKCVEDIPWIPMNKTETDSSISRQNEKSPDNKEYHISMRSINASFSSDTKTNKSNLTPSKTDINVDKITSEQRTIYFPSASEKCILENFQEVFDNLDCYSVSDLQETSDIQSKPVFCDLKECKTIPVQSLSSPKGTSSTPSDCFGSVPRGIICAPQKNPGLNCQHKTSAFRNTSVSSTSETHKTLQKLSAPDSVPDLSDSQICQLASEDFEHAFNSNETQTIHMVEGVHHDKFERNWSSAQTRSIREIEQRKVEGKKLVDAVIADLVSVNKQLLRMKREMETVKRVVQQQHKPRNNFHGKSEFGFRY